MGYSLSWLAVRGAEPETVLAALEFHPTGEWEATPEGDLDAVETTNGWFVVVSNHAEQVAPDEVLQKLSSAGAELVTCFVEEHVMVSRATGWKAGKMKWSVTHDAQKRPDHLETTGDLPAAYPAILADLKQKQEAADAAQEPVDYLFDVPVELARGVAGYRHDEDVPGMTGAVFEVLTAARKSSFLGRLFGG